jgi:RNA polymerase sigma-70 factor (ECF subfamily)
LEKNYLKDADPAKGRFRTFLLIALKRYLAKEWQRTNRQKRGGGLEMVTFEGEDIEERFLAEPSDSASPEKAYDRQWAFSLLARVLDRLEEDHAASGKGDAFRELKVFLTGDHGDMSYTEVGRKLGLTEGNVRITVHRLRRRYRAMLRSEIAETVANPDTVSDELQHLFSALS